MSTRMLGRILFFIGVFILITSLVVGFLGFGDRHIGPSQLLGMMSGIVVMIFALPRAFLIPDENFNMSEYIRGTLAKFFNIPMAAWVTTGFLIMYLLFFMSPMFLNGDWGVFYFVKYLPEARPIGLDIRNTINLVDLWVNTGQSPYSQSFYPPLTYIVFAPMALLNYPEYYVLITFLTILSSCALAILASLLISPSRDYSLIMLFFTTGVISYGFQFEIERGQSNVLVFFLCILSMYLFHRHYRYRHLAYLFLIVAIHIKLYPGIFIFMFVRDWRDWKTNIRRWIGLGILNFSLLFVLGFKEFGNFIKVLSTQASSPWTWYGNHSAQAFVSNLLEDGYDLVSPVILDILRQNSGLLLALLYLIIIGCILAVVARAYVLKENGFNPYLLGVCTLGALMIPPSYDYTMPILIAPLAMLFSSLPPASGFRMKLSSISLVLISSLAYASTLYPFKYKPYFMNNNFPPLLTILIAVTVLYFLKDTSSNFRTFDKAEGV